MQDKIVIKFWRSPESVSLILLNLKYEQKWPKRKKQNQRCINLYNSGCTDVVLYIPHAMALIISGRPRIPIVSAERILVHQIKFYHLKDISRKFAVGHNGFHPTPFCFSMFPVEIRKRKHKIKKMLKIAQNLNHLTRRTSNNFLSLRRNTSGELYTRKISLKNWSTLNRCQSIMIMIRTHIFFNEEPIATYQGRGGVRWIFGGSHAFQGGLEGG